MKLEYFLTSYAKINSKWIKDLNVRLEARKLLEENIGRTLFDINHSNIIVILSPKAKDIKAEINKWNLVRPKSFYTAKETINETKRQPTEWEKTFANDISNKGLINKTYKKLIQLDIFLKIQLKK